jgi:hypothetical protein
MILLLFVLSLIFSWAREPRSWQWLAKGDAAVHLDAALDALPQSSPAAGVTDAPPETIVAGPTDADKAEWTEASKLFEAVTDRAPLTPVEMPAYWRCMKWARAQSFAALERRSADRIFYTRLWEEPDKYRGKLLRLRLHIRRVLDYDAPKNSVGVKRVFEAWGWTDESKAFPYVVVFSELPQGMSLGPDVQDEGLFVGYFLKTMTYTASNAKRSAPLLIGRMKAVSSSANAAAARPAVGRGEGIWIAVAGLALLGLFLAATWLRLRHSRRAKRLSISTTHEAEMEDWFRNGPSAEPPHDIEYQK